MTKKTKTIIIVFGVLLLLAGGYYISTIWRNAQIEEFVWTPRQLNPILGNMDGSKIVRIEIPNMILERNNDQWELISLDGAAPPAWLILDQRQVTNMAYSFASIWTDGIVEEEPEDISIYGFDEPSFRAIVTDIDGNRVEYIRGDLTPSLTSYYFMEEGDPRVYTVFIFTAENLELSTSRIRPRLSFPMFDVPIIENLTIESRTANIAINYRPDIVPAYLSTSFSSHLLTSPYAIPRGAHNESFYDLVDNLNSITFLDYEDDEPSSLSYYGLDRPSRVFVQSFYDTLDILVGNTIGDNIYYAKLPNEPAVITVSGFDAILNATPFSLVDKFALISLIDNVDRLTVTEGSRSLTATFQGSNEDTVFHLNGRQAQDRPFREWYQAVIGLLFDGEISGPLETPVNTEENIVIEYELNIFPGARASITLVPYNRNFYALRQEGTMEFLISREQVNLIWERADSVLFID